MHTSRVQGQGCLGPSEHFQLLRYYLNALLGDLTLNDLSPNRNNILLVERSDLFQNINWSLRLRRGYLHNPGLVAQKQKSNAAQDTDVVNPTHQHYFLVHLISQLECQMGPLEMRSMHRLSRGHILPSPLATTLSNQPLFL